jgi:hypothetical protein
MGVAVSIDSMRFGLSEIEIDQVEIGNAKGYTLPKAFSAEEIELQAPLSTYFKDAVVIDEVNVNDIYLGIEFDSSSSSTGNWTKIMAHFKEASKLEKPSKKTALIKRLVFNNIRTEVLFRDSNQLKKLPMIRQIVLKNVSSEGGVSSDQLTNTILSRMLKQVFLEQNLNNMLKDLLLDTPGKAVEKAIKPFSEFFNAQPAENTQQEQIA